jgi:hypothetical protein
LFKPGGTEPGGAPDLTLTARPLRFLSGGSSTPGPDCPWSQGPGWRLLSVEPAGRSDTMTRPTAMLARESAAHDLASERTVGS